MCPDTSVTHVPGSDPPRFLPPTWTAPPPRPFARGPISPSRPRSAHAPHHASAGGPRAGAISGTDKMWATTMIEVPE